jgi:hypothetical protein
MNGTVTLPTHKRGDRWPGLTLGPVLFDGVAPTDPLDRVRMHFTNGTTRYRLDSDGTSTPARDNAIQITNASTWEATTGEIETGFLPTAGSWNFDIEFWVAGEGPRTLVSGSIFVSQDVTN